jgi:hypothetical protein
MALVLFAISVKFQYKQRLLCLILYPGVAASRYMPAAALYMSLSARCNWTSVGVNAKFTFW